MSLRRGELVHERRRQFGLPLPIADKILPFRPSAAPNTMNDDQPPIENASLTEATDSHRLRVALAEGRIAEAFAALQEAELLGVSRRVLDRFEEAYLAEVSAYQTVCQTYNESV